MKRLLYVIIARLLFLSYFSTALNVSYVDPTANQSTLTGTRENPYLTLYFALNNMQDIDNIIYFKNTSEILTESLEILDLEGNFTIKPENSLMMNIVIINKFHIIIEKNSSLSFENFEFTSNNLTFITFSIETQGNSMVCFKACLFIDLNFEMQIRSFLTINSNNVFNSTILQNIYMKNIIFPFNLDFVIISSNNTSSSFYNLINITVKNSSFSNANFIKLNIGSLVCQNLMFSYNILANYSAFFRIYQFFNISNALFLYNILSNSTMLSLIYSDSSQKPILLNYIEFSNNLCQIDDNLYNYFLLVVSVMNSPFIFNNSLIHNNFCLSPYIFINQTMEPVYFFNVSFLDNYSSKLLHFYMNFFVDFEFITCENNNNNVNLINDDNILVFLLNFAGSCFYFETIANLTIDNCIFSNCYSSILPTVFSFQENIDDLNFIISKNMQNPIFLIKNSKFLNNFFNYSDVYFPNKDQGCSITSTSTALIILQNSLFLNNSFNIPNNPIKGGPCLNINNENSKLLVENCDFLSNEANFQSNAIFFLGYNITIISSTFSLNQQYSQINVKLAGGIYMIFTIANVYNSVFNENTGYNGGISISLGLFSYQILIVNNCSFTGNWASYSGAGINIDETGSNRTCILTNTLFLHNYADNYAAAVFVFGAGATLYTNISFFSCIFNDNVAVWEGGAFSIWLYYPFYSIYFHECQFNGSKLIGSGNSIMGACLDYWGDSSWITTDTISVIKTFNCLFNNSFSFTGSGLYIVTAIYYDYNSVFNWNYAAKEGGTILLSDNSKIYLNYSKILNSQALYSAGSIGGKEQVNLFLNNVIFMGSYSKSGAGIYLDSNSLLFADNLTFNQNQGDVGSGILIRNTNNLISYLNNSKFSNNTGSYSVIQIEYSTLYMDNSILEYSNVACFSTYSSVLQLYRFIFRENHCLDQITGCSLYIREGSNVFLYNSQMINIYGVTVGTVYIEFSSLNVFNSSFVACFSEYGGDVLTSSYSNIFLEYIKISNFSSEPFNMDYSDFTMKYTDINNYFNVIVGSVIVCSDCANFVIDSCNFSKINSTGNGAGLNLQNYFNKTLENQQIYIKNSSFSLLSAQIGGGLYLNNINILIITSTFQKNSAENGGSIYFSCDSDFLTNCLINLTNNSFYYSSAIVAGGGIKWSGKKPINIDKNYFQNNRGKYGKNVASFPVRLGFSIISKSDNSTIYDTIQNHSNATYLSNEQSGGKFSNNLLFYFLDENDEKIQTIAMDYLKIDIYKSTIPEGFLNKSFLNITYDNFYNGDSNEIFGETLLIINPEYSNFLITDLTVIGTPTSILYLQISTMYTSIDPLFKSTQYNNNPHDLYLEESNEYFFILPVVLRECIPGEIYNSSDNKCLECVSGKYSFSPKDPINNSLSSQCLTCISNSICPGGSQILINQGFWRKNKFSIVLYQCSLNSMSCLGGENSDCEEGYTGSLCENCLNDVVIRSKNFMNWCQECPNIGIGVFIEIILMLLLIGLVVFIYQLYRINMFKNKIIRFLVKLLINYFQFIYVSGSFNVELPIAIKGYISAFEVYTLITRNWINSSCLLTQMNISSIPQFSHLIAGYFFFIAITIFSFFIRKFGLSKEIDIDSSRAQKSEMFVTICYLLNGPLVFLALHCFKCISIENGLYLEDSPDYECFNLSHILILLFFSLPILLLFLVLYPLFLKLAYLRNGVYNVRFKYCKIWNIGYIHDSKKIYFEFYQLFAKYLLIGFIVFFNKDDIKKSITCFFLILSFTQSFLIIKPYKYKFFTQMSILAYSSIGSIYLSFILYFSNTSSPDTRAAFVSIMLMLNTGFIFTLIYFISSSTRKKKFLRKESILDISYELRFKAFKTFGTTSIDKKDRGSVSSSTKNPPPDVANVPFDGEEEKK